MARQRDETVSEALTRLVYSLVFWLITLSVVVIETNWILSLSQTARNAVGVAVLLGVFGVAVAFAFALRGARDSDEVKDLLKTALANPGKIQYQLGALKKGADDWMREGLTEAGTDGPEVYAGGQKVE
jgi:hypothetical protein